MDKREKSIVFIFRPKKSEPNTKGTFNPLEILMVSEKQYRSIETRECACVCVHTPLQEMNMHKIACFQFSCHAFFSFSTLLLSILCVLLFMLVLFRNRLFVAFVFCIFVIRSRLHTHCKTHIHNADLNAPHDMLMHACKSIEMKRRQ